MRPRATLNNRSDIGMTNTKTTPCSTDALAVGDGAPYLLDLFLGEFRVGVLRAPDAPAGSTSLPDHIRHVVCLCPDEEVPWVNALPNIAVVADIHAVGDVTTEQLPSDAMCVYGDALDIQRSVTVLRYCASPDPALPSLANALIEPINNGSTEAVPVPESQRRAALPPLGYIAAGRKSRREAAPTLTGFCHAGNIA